MRISLIVDKMKHLTEADFHAHIMFNTGNYTQ